MVKVERQLVEAADFVAEEQIGFLLRQAYQRYTVIFSENIPSGLTATQFAVLAKLNELTSCSQNALGRYTSMDAATVKGVVERLKARGLVATKPCKVDKRRLNVLLSKKGKKAVVAAIEEMSLISDEMMASLNKTETRSILRILKKLGTP